MKQWIRIAEDLLFPPRCPVCDGIAPSGESICPECFGKFKLLTPPWCMKCGKKLEQEGELCGDCKRKEHLFVKGRILYEYDSVVSSIYRLKYGGRREYADFFGEEMAKYLGPFIRQVRPDGIVPIPLHPKRMKVRGYNQAALLAKALGKHCEVPVYEHYLERRKNTLPLKLQNPKERQNNLKKAFNIAENDVKLKQIILIDDIYTTGSTMDEASRTLLQHGAQEIYFLTLSGGSGV